MSINKFEKYGLLVISALFVAFYFLLSYNNRLASDDLSAHALVKKIGWLETSKSSYYNWSGRWASTSYYTIMLSLSKQVITAHWFLFLYQIISVVLFIYAVYLILTSLLEYFYDTIPAVSIRVCYAVLFCAVFYFSTFQTIDVWFWACSSFCYLQMIIFSAIGAALIISSRQFFLKNILIAFCFLYVGGALEIYSLILLILFSILLVYLIKHKKLNWKELRKNNFVKSILIAFTCLLISSAINYVAPGNFKRQERLSAIIKTNLPNDITQTQNIPDTLGSGKELMTALFQKKHFTLLLFLSPWMLLGIVLKSSDRKKNALGFSYRKLIMLSVSLLLLFCTIHVSAALYLFGNIGGALRFWTPLCFLVAVLFCVWSFILGYKAPLMLKYKSAFSFVCFLLLILAMLMYFFRQYPLVTHYSKAYDNRINYLNTLKEKGYTDTLIMLDPLPDSGMIARDDGSGLRKALGFNFEIKIKGR